jgi:hypothetical protein
VLRHNPGIDHREIRKWLAEFEAVLGEPCVARFNELTEAK